MAGGKGKKQKATATKKETVVEPITPKIDDKPTSDSGHESSATASPVHDGSAVSVPTGEQQPQDTGSDFIRLHILCPGGESFDLQVGTGEMVQEITQVLLEREQTCHRTCFALQVDGVTLDMYTEMRNCEAITDGCTVNVVELPYTLRDARLQVRQVRELIKGGAEVTEAACGLDGQTLHFLPSLMPSAAAAEKATLDAPPPDHVLPGSKDRLLTPLLASHNKQPQALRNLALSPYNPPVGPRKMKGDVLYLVADLVERRRVYITCSTKGFYVNSSTDEQFKPQPSGQNKQVFHSLVELLQSVSPGFKKAYSVLVKARAESNVLARLPAPYLTHSWLAPHAEPTEDSIRAEDACQPQRLGFEDQIPGQIRDWNEELQTTHQMSKASLPERIVRDRSVFKIHSDFVSAAVKGAQAVVDGNVLAINPAEDPKTHMFLWNNIFFSLGFDVKDHYKELGGDAAAFVATSADLQGVRAYASLDDQQLGTIGMVVVDYKGCRVTAQSIIPGILDREQEESIVYGSVDFGKTINSCDKFEKLLEKSAEELKLLPHELIVGEGEEEKRVQLFSSYETKGIVGNDGRSYVLDLLRTFPPDVHFQQGARVSERAAADGFPRAHPHKLAALRQELIEQFVEDRYVQFIRVAAEMVNEHRTKTGQDADAMKEKLAAAVLAGEPVEQGDGVPEGVLEKAAEAVHSLQPNKFDVRFNPDCLSTTVKHAASEEELEKQKQLLVDAAEFLLYKQLPEFVRDCAARAVVPVDGENLVEMLHLRGINARYLGEIYKLCPSDTLIGTLAVAELAARCVKRVLRPLIYSAVAAEKAACIAHLFNCILGDVDAVGNPAADAGKDKKGKKAKRTPSGGCGEWANQSTSSLWQKVRAEAAGYYGAEVAAFTSASALAALGVQPVSLFRRVSRILGVQMLCKDYKLDARTPFTEDDVQNLLPVLRHRQPWTADAKKMYMRGQAEMQAGRLQNAYEFIAEAVNVMTSVYGAMHAELAVALRMLARLSYILGDPVEALAQQHKATLLSERCNGIDHAYTVVEYINLALFAFANLYVPSALQLLYRARHLMLIIHGENHPLMAQIDGSLGVVLYAVQDFDLALRFLQSALAIEKNALKVGTLQRIVSRCNACRGEFRLALAAEKETFTVYNRLFGADHEKTKESSAALRELTSQAVVFQKKMNEAATQKAGVAAASLAQILPMQQQPLSTVLDAMNMINGVVVFQFAGEAAKEEEGEKEEKKAVKQPVADDLD